MFPEHSDEDSESSVSGAISGGSTTIQRDTIDDAQVLGEVISTLPKDVRRAFLLHRKDEMGFEQIAVQMDISPREVEAHIAQALKLIRSGLQ